jgi:hypothetical protein
MTRENGTLYNIYYIIYNATKNKIQNNLLLTLCDTISIVINKGQFLFKVLSVVC